MKIAIVYIYPEGGANGHFEKAIKFLQTYAEHGAGTGHDTVIVCNGGPVNAETEFLFSAMPNVSFLAHDDSGMDIGGFQAAARAHDCDLMVFFGGNTYFRRGGWLIKMVQAYEQHGDTLYGSTGNQGDMRFNVYPHVRTTGFWMRRALFNSYPVRITQNSQRYEFEHGRTGLTSWIVGTGRHPYIVAWDGAYSLYGCDSIPNGFHQGDQSNILIGDRLTAPPYWPYE